ncbi:MAG: DNA translocase FtsK 4TM domain-containing protein, partial [Candidatus Krumholzibacteria bacterium]|nr:DNA translocase FtsK 4TM domain-containing protein [Candidatus Krumholzibacteria bacterium]
MKNVKKNISIGVMLSLFALFTAVALYSFEEGDWGRFWGVANLCGPIGAALAGSLRYIFGTVFSWFWPALLLYWASLVVRGRSIKENWPRVTSCFVMLCALFSLIRTAAGGEWGGNVMRVTTDLLELVTGRIGSVLILVAILLLTSIILFFGSIKQFFI